MTATVWPVDAVSGAPEYTGRMLRQVLGAVWGGKTSRPLGCRSGVIWESDSALASISGSTVTVGAHVGVIDAEAAAQAGPYGYSFDAATTVTVNAADASNPRIDIIYVQISDPAESDGSSTPGVAIGYLAGTAASTPAQPATPARSILLDVVSVPKAGGGSATVADAFPFAAAAGAPVKVRSQAERDALPKYSGLSVVRLDARSRVETYDGPSSRWDCDWISLAVASGWQPWYQTPGYRVRDGRVEFRGAARTSTGAAIATSTWSQVLTGFDQSLVPAGYTNQLFMPCVFDSGRSGIISPRSAGTLSVYAPDTGASIVYLEGASFALA